MRRSGVPLRDIVALLALISMSGLSVSAFNNVFVAITLAVAMGLDRGSPQDHQPARDIPDRRRGQPPLRWGTAAAALRDQSAAS
jgi:hypothetical protein